MQVIKYVFQPHGDDRGQLVALEEFKDIPFRIKRVYYMYDTGEGVVRGHHAHKSLQQILICIHGSCKIRLDNGREKEFTVRCPMKRVESNPGTAFLKRCHRSYLLNPSHVRVLGKNKEGVIIATLDNSPETCIPVGKQYYETLSQMIL